MPTATPCHQPAEVCDPKVRWALHLATLFAGLTIWVRPGPAILYGIDAACYARIASRWLLDPAASWLDMRLDGAAFYEHPPGMMWLLAIGFGLGGVTSDAAIAVAHVLATFVLYGTQAMAKRLAGPAAALGTVLSLCTLSGFFYESQNPMLELPLTVGMLVAALGLVHLDDRPKVASSLVALGTTWAVWSKGPPGLAVLALAAWCGATKRATWRSLMWAGAATLCALVVTVGAFEFGRYQVGLPSFIAGYVRHQLWPSMTTGHHHRVISRLYYGKVLWRWYPPGLVFACALWVLRALTRLKSRPYKPPALEAFAWVWLATFILSFSVMPQKYQWYMHVVMPAAAWLGGAACTQLLSVRRMLGSVWLPRLLGVAIGLYLGMARWAPYRLGTKRPVYAAMVAAPAPQFAPGEPHVVALCDAPLHWTEGHLGAFLWQAQIVDCHTPAPYRYQAGRMLHEKSDAD